MAESSKHYKRYELECHGDDCCDHTCYVDPTLLVVLDRFRVWVDVPVPLSCAFRCLRHNGDVGSDDTSQHPKGTAADVRKLLQIKVDTMADWFEAQPEVGAVGRYWWGCHVDVRPRINGKVTTWDDRVN